MNGNHKPLPDPEKVWAHSVRVMELVDKVMVKNPQARGNYRLLVSEVYKLYGVRYHRDWKTGEIHEIYRDFEHRMSGVPSPMTIIRRAQELIAWNALMTELGQPDRYHRTEYTKSKRAMIAEMYGGYYGHQAKLMEAMG